MWLTRSMAGSAPGNLTWHQPGDVVEVPDDLALELLAIPDAGFSEVHAPDVPAADSDVEADAAPPARTPRTRKTPVSE